MLTITAISIIAEAQPVISYHSRAVKKNTARQNPLESSGSQQLGRRNDGCHPNSSIPPWPQGPNLQLERWVMHMEKILNVQFTDTLK